MVCKVCNYYIPDGAIRCAHCGAYRKKWRNHCTWANFGIATSVILVLLIGVQSSNIKTQTDKMVEQTKIFKDSYKVEHRPYLYLDLRDINDINLRGISVWRNFPGSGWYGGGNLHFINTGKEPATIINSKYMVASDRKGDTNFIEWFQNAYGGFTDVSVVMPNQEDVHVPCHPIIADGNERPRLLYIGATITYKGSNPDKTYWFKFSQLFIIEFKKLPNKLVIIGHPHTPDHDWDQNKNINPPILKEPDWQEYLSRNYIKTLTKID